MEQIVTQAGSPKTSELLQTSELCATPARRPKPRLTPLAMVKLLASLRITVVLFVLSILLVFFGTLAQVDADIWTVVNKYFRSGYVWVPFQIFFPRTQEIGGGFPFPGGWLLGGLLLVNLLAAHAVRFKVSWRRSGILLIHAGLIVMMLSEVIAGVFAIESKMVIRNGETVNFLDHGREVELAIVDSSQSGVDDVVVVPEKLMHGRGTVRSELLPFDIAVQEYMPNSVVKLAHGRGADAVAASDGESYTAVPVASESGVGSGENVASVRLAFQRKDTGAKLGEGLFSLWFCSNLPTKFMDKLRFQPQRVKVDGKEYRVELRFKRTYTPYSLHLLEFRHDVYPGTNTPKNFSSRIDLLDPERKEHREVTISMNAPLRYAGQTFYQASFIPGDIGTVLQVVHNPGWLMPYISCVMVALGMIIHFGLNLWKFLQRRTAL